MKKILLVVSVLALSACGSSNDTTTGENTVAGEENATEATTANATAQPSVAAVASEAPAAPAAAASETWKCNGGGGTYSLVLSNLKEQTNPRGGSETSGKYRIKGTNSFDIPGSGDFSIRGGVYFLNDSIDFEPAQDGSDSIAHFAESGDVSECTKG